MKLLNQISDNEHTEGELKYQISEAANLAGVIEEPNISYKCLHKSTATCQYFSDDALFFEACKV